ncbi:MAG: PAS domain S-box protein [Candidatus Aminicenantes bacterium]|nr:PAS domain S-box protein [Candidatus Aminicenantes bacterium]
MKNQTKDKNKISDEFEKLKNKVVRLERLKKEQEAVFKISEAVHSAKSLEDLYQKIHEIISRLMPAEDNFYIALYDEKEDLLKFPYFVDQEEPAPTPQKLGKGLTEYVLRTGRPVLAPPHVFDDLVEKGEVVSVGPASVDWLGVPLKIKNKTIGVLAVQSYQQGLRYTEEDKHILHFVSEQVAIAISRKKSEQELAERNALFRLVVNNSPSGIFTVDDHFRLTYLNDKALEIIGYSKEEIIGEDFRKVLDQESKDLVIRRYRQRQRGEDVPPKYEFKVIRKDGCVRLVEVVSGIFKTSAGDVQTEAHIRDVTEHRDMEMKLKESEKRYKNLVEKARIAILIDDEEGQFKYFNDRLCEMFGYKREELEKKKIMTIVHSDDHEKVINLHKSRVAGKKAKTSYEFKGIKKDGTVIFCEVDAVVLKQQGKIIGTRSYIRDITESKKDKQRIEASLREKEVLLREIHHRVKNNMQVISSLLSLQSRGIKDGEVQEIFNESQRRIKTMAMVHEKLYRSEDLSRIDFAKYLSSLIQYLFHSYGIDSQKIILKKEIEEISLDINTAIPLGLLVNELISNSLKHGFPNDRKGEVKVSMKKSKSGQIKVMVTDNGVGVPDQTDLKKSGSFGLQLVKMLTKQLHGSMKMISNEEISFIITFEELKHSA